MKKTKFFLGALALFGAVSYANANEKQDLVAAEPVAAESTVDADRVYFSAYFIGTIGGYDATMEIVSGEGYVSLEGSGTRTLSVKSKSGSKLVINAYLNGKYIGYYSGTYNVRNGHYKGVFYNTRSGGRVNFDLWELND